jgi:hypothetical protein
MLRINLWEVQLKMIKKAKHITIKSAIACSLPRETLLNSKDKLHLDSNTFNKCNNQDLLKHSDSHCLKLIQLFTIRLRCSKFKVVEIQLLWELMNSIFLEKQFWWLKIRLVLCNLCSSLDLSNNLHNNSKMLILNQCSIKMLETSTQEDNHLSMDKNK